MVQGINPEGMWRPLGRGFSQAVVQPPGRVVHVSGQVAFDADSRIVAPGIRYQVAALTEPGLLVEVAPIAVIPEC